MLEGGSVCPKDTFEEGIMPGAHLVFPGSLGRKGSLMGWEDQHDSHLLETP